MSKPNFIYYVRFLKQLKECCAIYLVPCHIIRLYNRSLSQAFETFFNKNKKES